MVDFIVPGLFPACAPAAPGPSSSSSSSSSPSHCSKDLSTSPSPSPSSSSLPSRLTAGASEPPPTSAAVLDDGASDIAVLRQYIDLFEKTSSFALDSENGDSPVSNPGGCRLLPRERPAASLLPSSDPRGPALDGEESGDQETGNRTGAQGVGAGAGSAGDEETDPAASELHSMLGFRLRSTLQLLLLLRQTEVLGVRLYRILCEQRGRKERLRRQRKTSSQDGGSHEMFDEGEEEALVVSGVVDAWARTSELSEGQALRWIFARYRSVRVLVALEAWLQWEARHLAGLRGASASSPFSLEGTFSGTALTGFRNSAERHMQSARILGKKAPSASDLPGSPSASAAPSLFYHADWPYVLPGVSSAWSASSSQRGAEVQLGESPPSSGPRSSFSHSAPLISEVDRRETREFFAGVWQLLRMGKLLEAEKQAVERGAAWLVEVIRGDEPWMEPYVSDDVDVSLQVEDVFTDREIRLLSDASPILKACLWPSGYSLQHVALAAREEGKEELRGFQGSLKRSAELEKKTEENAELCSAGAFALKNAGIAAALNKKQMGWYGEGKKGRSLLVHVCQRILAKQQDPTVSLSVSSSAPVSARISPPCASFDFAAAAGKGAVGVLAGLGVGEKVETQKGGFAMESFEQAIYGYLSGSLEAMEHVSTGWADCLFALVRAIKASLIDGTLRCMRSHEPHGRFAGEPRRGGFLPPIPRRKNGKCCPASPASSADEVNRVSSTSFSSRTEGSVSASPRKKRRTLQEHGSSLNDFSASREGVSPQSSPRSDLPDGYLSVCAVGKEEHTDEEGAGTLRRRKSLYDPLRILLTDFLRPQSAAFEDDAEVAGQERKGAPEGEAVETPEEESGEKTCCCGRAWVGEEAETREASPALPPGDEGRGVEEGGDAFDCEAEEARKGGEGGRNERIDEESCSFFGEERCAKQVDEGVLALLFNIMNDLPLFLRRFVPSAHSREQIVTEGADELRLLQLFLVFLFLQHASSPPTHAACQWRTGEAEEAAAKDEREERSLYAKSVKKLLRKTFRHGPRLVLPRKTRVEGAETEAVDLVTVSCSPSLSFQEFTAFFVVLQGDLKQPFLAFPSSLASPASQLSLSLPVLSPPRELRECDGEEDAHDAEGLSVRDADFLVGGFVAHIFQQLPVCDVLLHVKVVELLRYVSSERRVKLLGDWMWRRFAARYWESREGRELLEECVSWIASNFPQDVLRVALRCAERSWHCSRPLVVSGRGARVGRGDRDADSEGGEDESSGPGDCASSEGHDEEETDSQEERLIFDERREETAVERLQFSVFLVLSVFSLYYMNRKFQSHADQPLALLLKDSAATSSLLPLSSLSSLSPPPSRWLLLLGLYCLGVIAHLGLLGLCLDFRGLVRLTRSLLRQNAACGPAAETSEDLGERGAPKAFLEPNAPEGAARRGPPTRRSVLGAGGTWEVSPGEELGCEGHTFRGAFGEGDGRQRSENRGEKAELGRRADRQSKVVSGLGDWIRFAVDPGLVSPVLDLLLQELDDDSGRAGEPRQSVASKRREDEEERKSEAARDAETASVQAGGCRPEPARFSVAKEAEKKGKAALEREEETEAGHDLGSRTSTVSFVSCDEPSQPSSLPSRLNPIEKLRTALIGGAPVLRLRDRSLLPTMHLVQFHDLLTASTLTGAVERRLWMLAPPGVCESRGLSSLTPSTHLSSAASSILSAAAALFRTSALFFAHCKSRLANEFPGSRAVSLSRLRSDDPFFAGPASASSEEGASFFPLLSDTQREEEAAAIGALELESRLQLEQLSRHVAALLRRSDEARIPSVEERDRRVDARKALLSQLGKERRKLKTHTSLASLFHVPSFVEEDETLVSADAESCSAGASPCGSVAQSEGQSPDNHEALQGLEERPGDPDFGDSERRLAASRMQEREGRRGKAALLLLLRSELLGQAQQLVVLWSRVENKWRETEVEGKDLCGPAAEGEREGKKGDVQNNACQDAAGLVVFASEVLATTASRLPKAEAMLQQALGLGDFS
ncbi:UNVERIFIED_CONTAM: hypothetical protein HHA_275490 [Hammondia hammondi]|eukprot:XP_008886607.1 hypothetical protein HHA_275490 [Hammondia hammondi]